CSFVTSSSTRTALAGSAGFFSRLIEATSASLARGAVMYLAFPVLVLIADFTYTKSTRLLTLIASGACSAERWTSTLTLAASTFSSVAAAEIVMQKIIRTGRNRLPGMGKPSGVSGEFFGRPGTNGDYSVEGPFHVKRLRFSRPASSFRLPRCPL